MADYFVHSSSFVDDGCEFWRVPVENGCDLLDVAVCDSRNLGAATSLFADHVAGVSEDAGLARTYAQIRTLRLADGPDEVHRRAIARLEYKKHR